MHELSQPGKQVLFKAEFAYPYMFLHNWLVQVRLQP
jgi:hypothetical protein